ncbi:MAG: DUF402 domain-containing protein [bacterium]|nr:DUF402 domain-containing protein [bacterium]
MKRKFSKIKEANFLKKSLNYKNIKGTVYYIKFGSNIIPSFVESEKSKLCIKNKDYVWFEFYPNEKSYLLTIMFDNKLNIIQWYFDVSKFADGNCSIPYQDDLYLDLVITPARDFTVLDEDELFDALQKKEITKIEFDYAYDVLKQLINKFAHDFNCLLNLTNYILELFAQETSGKNIIKDF